MIRSVWSPGPSENTSDYRRVFIVRVHQLIKMGYDRMTPADYQAEEEPAITGALVEAICEVFDETPEEWVDFFTVHDDPPVNDGTRRGKRRFRLDIKIVSAEMRPRQVFSFEAKRLDESHSVSAYLGVDGLGCFLQAKYARTEDDGGMLGYTQSGDLDTWAVRIDQALAASPRLYGVGANHAWQQWREVAGLSHCYRSRHQRRAIQRGIDIYHTLLSFQ